MFKSKKLLNNMENRGKVLFLEQIWGKNSDYFNMLNIELRYFYEESYRFGGFFLNLKYITKKELINFLLFHNATEFMIADLEFLTKLSFFFSLFKTEAAILYLITYLTVFDLYYLFTSNDISFLELQSLVREFNLSIDKIFYIHNVRKKLLDISEKQRKKKGGDMRLLFYTIVFNKYFIEECLIETYVSQAISNLIVALYSNYDKYEKIQNKQILIRMLKKFKNKKLNNNLINKLNFLDLSILHEFNLFFRFIIYKLYLYLNHFIIQSNNDKYLKKNLYRKFQIKLNILNKYYTSFFSLRFSYIINKLNYLNKNNQMFIYTIYYLIKKIFFIFSDLFYNDKNYVKKIKKLYDFLNIIKIMLLNFNKYLKFFEKIQQNFNTLRINNFLASLNFFKWSKELNIQKSYNTTIFNSINLLQLENFAKRIYLIKFRESSLVLKQIWYNKKLTYKKKLEFFLMKRFLLFFNLKNNNLYNKYINKFLIFFTLRSKEWFFYKYEKFSNSYSKFSILSNKIVTFSYNLYESLTSLLNIPYFILISNIIIYEKFKYMHPKSRIASDIEDFFSLVTTDSLFDWNEVVEDNREWMEDLEDPLLTINELETEPPQDMYEDSMESDFWEEEDWYIESFADQLISFGYYVTRMSSIKYGLNEIKEIEFNYEIFDYQELYNKYHQVFMVFFSKLSNLCSVYKLNFKDLDLLKYVSILEISYWWDFWILKRIKSVGLIHKFSLFFLGKWKNPKRLTYLFYKHKNYRNLTKKDKKTVDLFVKSLIKYQIVRVYNIYYKSSSNNWKVFWEHFFLCSVEVMKQFLLFLDWVEEKEEEFLERNGDEVVSYDPLAHNFIPLYNLGWVKGDKNVIGTYYDYKYIKEDIFLKRRYQTLLFSLTDPAAFFLINKNLAIDYTLSEAFFAELYRNHVSENVRDLQEVDSIYYDIGVSNQFFETLYTSQDTFREYMENPKEKQENQDKYYSPLLNDDEYNEPLHSFFSFPNYYLSQDKIQYFNYKNKKSSIFLKKLFSLYNKHIYIYNNKNKKNFLYLNILKNKKDINFLQINIKNKQYKYIYLYINFFNLNINRKVKNFEIIYFLKLLYKTIIIKAMQYFLIKLNKLSFFLYFFANFFYFLCLKWLKKKYCLSLNFSKLNLNEIHKVVIICLSNLTKEEYYKLYLFLYQNSLKMFRIYLYSLYSYEYQQIFYKNYKKILEYMISINGLLLLYNLFYFVKNDDNELNKENFFFKKFFFKKIYDLKLSPSLRNYVTTLIIYYTDEKIFFSELTDEKYLKWLYGVNNNKNILNFELDNFKDLEQLRLLKKNLQSSSTLFLKNVIYPYYNQINSYYNFEFEQNTKINFDNAIVLDSSIDEYFDFGLWEPEENVHSEDEDTDEVYELWDDWNEDNDISTEYEEFIQDDELYDSELEIVGEELNEFNDFNFELHLNYNLSFKEFMLNSQDDFFQKVYYKNYRFEFLKKQIIFNFLNILRHFLLWSISILKRMPRGLLPGAITRFGLYKRLNIDYKQIIELINKSEVNNKVIKSIYQPSIIEKLDIYMETNTDLTEFNDSYDKYDVIRGFIPPNKNNNFKKIFFSISQIQEIYNLNFTYYEQQYILNRRLKYIIFNIRGLGSIDFNFLNKYKWGELYIYYILKVINLYYNGFFILIINNLLYNNLPKILTDNFLKYLLRKVYLYVLKRKKKSIVFFNSINELSLIELKNEVENKLNDVYKKKIDNNFLKNLIYIIKLISNVSFINFTCLNDVIKLTEVISLYKIIFRNELSIFGYFLLHEHIKWFLSRIPNINKVLLWEKILEIKNLIKLEETIFMLNQYKLIQIYSKYGLVEVNYFLTSKIIEKQVEKIFSINKYYNILIFIKQFFIYIILVLIIFIFMGDNIHLLISGRLFTMVLTPISNDLYVHETLIEDPSESDFMESFLVNDELGEYNDYFAEYMDVWGIF